MSRNGTRRPGTGTTDVVVIGAGHSGLAMSAWLSAHSIDHVVLERGEIANAWRHERWDSLRLLTPNWQTRLPDYRYDGDDPDGFMGSADVAQFISRYAGFIGATVRTGTTVRSVTRHGDMFHVCTEQRGWRCQAVVMANGAHGIAQVPALAAKLPASVRSLSAKDYRNPGRLDDAGVPVPGLAESWTRNEDLTEITLRLRHGVTFHDGTHQARLAGPSSQRRTKAAAVAPAHCASTYGATSRPGNLRTDQNAIVTAGLMWAPLKWPTAAITKAMTRPNASATPICPNACVAALTITAPGPTATSANVPIASAA